MTQIYSEKVDLILQSTNISNQKIHSSPLKTDRMVIAEFLIHDKLESARYFEETFLLIDTNLEMILMMSFLFLSNVNLQLGAKKLKWRMYIAAETMPITWQIELINKY